MPRMLAANEFLTSLSLFWANCRASVGMAAVAIDCASAACGMSMSAKAKTMPVTLPEGMADARLVLIQKLS